MTFYCKNKTTSSLLPYFLFFSFYVCSTLASMGHPSMVPYIFIVIKIPCTFSAAIYIAFFYQFLEHSIIFVNVKSMLVGMDRFCSKAVAAFPNGKPSLFHTNCVFRDINLAFVRFVLSECCRTYETKQRDQDASKNQFHTFTSILFLVSASQYANELCWSQS